MSLYEREVSENCLFVYVLLSIDHLGWLRLRQDLGDLRPGNVFDRNSPLLHQGIDSSPGVESSQSSTSGSNLLRQCALRTELQLDITTKVQGFVVFVVSQIGGNHSFDLPVLQQEFKTPGMVTVGISSSAII